MVHHGVPFILGILETKTVSSIIMNIHILPTGLTWHKFDPTLINSNLLINHFLEIFKIFVKLKIILKAIFE